MVTSLRIALIFAIGTLVATFGFQATHSNQQPAAYLIVESDVSDQISYAAIKAAEADEIVKQGGTVLSRDEKPETIAGTPGKEILVTEWPSRDAAKRWYNSDAMKSINQARDRSARSRILVVKGKIDWP